MSPAVSRRRARRPTKSGAWRPDEPFHGEGLKVTLRRERGVTPKGLLQVPFRFHAPPTDRWGRRWEREFPTYETIEAGEQPQSGGRRLQRPSFQTMLLDEEHAWMVWTGSLDVQRMLREMRALEDREAPFRLIVSQPGLWGPKPLMSLVVVFTVIGAEQRGGELGVEYTDVEFMQWPRQQLERGRRPGDRDQEDRHRLVAGDTLYRVARKAYGRSSAWRSVATVNGIKGVSPDDAGELKRWADRRDRKTLKVPPIQRASINRPGR